MTGRLPALAAMMAVAALGWPARALADPVAPTPAPAPAPPAAADLIPAIGNVLGQSGNPATGPLGLPDLSSYGTNMLLGQTALPSPPGTPAAAVPDLRVFNPDYLLPQNLTPAPPGQGSPAPGIGPNEDISGTGRIAFLHRLYEMYQDGGLKGGLLGQQSPAEFDAQPAGEPAASPTG